MAWRSLEESSANPLELREVLFANTPKKKCMDLFFPSISHLVVVWHRVGKVFEIDSIWTSHSPIFNNESILIDKCPIKRAQCKQWWDNGVRALGKLIDLNGLLSFDDLRIQFNLQHSTFFFYLQLRTAMKTYGVPWQAPLKNHPLLDLIISNHGFKGLVSKLYAYVLQGM